MPGLRAPNASAGLLAIAGLVAWACAPTAPVTRPTPAPTVAPPSSTTAPEPIAGGTVTLTDEGCAWVGNPASAGGGPVVVDVHNATADYGVFVVHRLKPEFTWQDGRDAIAAIQRAMVAGADWPNWSTQVSIVAGEGTADAGATGTATVPAIAGTYGIVCSANRGPTGDVLSVFLAGPLEMTD